jgi:hypothetical protein
MNAINKTSRWMPQKDYQEGDIVVRKGFVYRCRVPHLSAYSNNPNAPARRSRENYYPGKYWERIVGKDLKELEPFPTPVGKVDVFSFTPDEENMMRWMLSQFYAMCKDPGGGIYDEENQTICMATIQSISKKMGIELMDVEYGFVIDVSDEEE